VVGRVFLVAGAAGGAGGQKVGLGAPGPDLQAQLEVGAGPRQVVPLQGTLGAPEVMVSPEVPAGEISAQANEGQDRDQEKRPLPRQAPLPLPGTIGVLNVLWCHGMKPSASAQMSRTIRVFNASGVIR
jgi:hypothetical protein